VASVSLCDVRFIDILVVGSSRLCSLGALSFLVLACLAICTDVVQEGFEGQMNENNIEIGVADASGFRRLEVCSIVAVLMTD
jgi:hypothetical protein